MTYKESNPTFNTNNRKVFHFSDFCNNIKSEEEELKKVKRSFVKTGEYNFPSQTKYKWNKVTRKMDDLSQDMVDGKIDAIEELDESKINEDINNQFILNKLIDFIEVSTKTIKVCTPSDDYYARGNDWQSEDISFVDANTLINLLKEEISKNS